VTDDEQAVLDAALADIAELQAEKKIALEATAEMELAAESRSHLARDHRVWARAWPSAPSIRPQGNPREEDSLAQQVELVARAALTDSIAEVCDGRRAGLEAAVMGQLRAILGDPEVASILAMLKKLRDADQDELLPASVTAVTRPHIATLTHVSEKLPADGDARKLLAKVMNLKKAPPAGLPDLLYRVLKQNGQSDADCEQAYSAAQSIVAAFPPPP